MRRTGTKKILAATVAFMGTGLALLSLARAVTITDYTSNPLFIGQTVPPNILFIVDLSNATIPAAYSGSGHQYPISAKVSTPTSGLIASNVTLSGLKLVSVNTASTPAKIITCADSTETCNTGLLTSPVTTPSDLYDSTKTYFGLFDNLRCYVQGGSGQPFTHGSVKASLSSTCGTAHWDGNFLNWLGMRKKDVAFQVLIGGTSKPAQANTDGTADKLAGEDVTGENGSNNDCIIGNAINNGDSCWRYVKFVPAVTLVGRVPSTVAPFTTADAAGDTVNTATGLGGRFFGLGEGKIYVNADNDDDFFDAASSSAQFKLEVNLNTEPDVPGAGASASTVSLENRNCTVGDAFFAGHLACYKRDRSLGLFQKLRTDNMRVGVMFSDATGGKGGRIQFKFDDSFNAASITGIRNQAVKPHAPLAEATYEALCLYRQTQGPCYNNSPADFAVTTGAAGDPFFFVSQNQTVSCCKSFILMISPGVPISDGNTPDLQTPFGNLMSTGVSNLGLTSTQLDDVAFYGHTNDIRNQPSGDPGFVTGSQKLTSFYAVNSMGGPAGATTLSSAAKFGGFEDRDNDGVVDETGQTCTFPAGSNLGTGSSTSSAEWDLDKDCTPDTYFDASEGGDLQNQINKAISDILRRAASGTSVSVLATSSTGEGALYQAYFFPSQFEVLNEIKWTGFTQGLYIDTFGNLREDYSGAGCTGPPDGKLVLDHDCIIKVRFDALTNEARVDRFKDLDSNGEADTTSPFETVGLKDVKPIWEAGARLAYLDPGASCTLANAGVSCRRILTWVDTNNDKTVTASEVIELAEANKATLCPYLGGTNVSTCVSGGAGGAGQTEAANIIKFHRGEDGKTLCVSGVCLRDRTLTVRNPDDVTSTATKVWKLGDVVDSTPTVVGAPKERFDIIFGDGTYTTFFKQYRTRRQVAYVGANDGMLHAFNAGFFVSGDDSSTGSIVERARFDVTAPADVTTTRANPKLGAELWAFVPQELLPHLRWYTQTDYTHVFAMDLKPKVTDARIFTPDADHPEGWGTILIAGMRFGGSCGACTSTNGGTPMTVTSDFGSGTQTRAFYSAYYALDITNPEKDPTVLWVFTDSTLGLTFSFPAVLRVSPTTGATSGKTDNTDAKWLAVFGTGPTGYLGNSSQTAKFFVVNMKDGPGYAVTTQITGSLHSASCTALSPCIVAAVDTATARARAFSTGDANSFMGDIITLDNNLDYRVDVIYAGNVISNGSGTPKWFGKMYRLTTGSSTDTSTWGILSGSNRIPTALIATFAFTSAQSTTCATASPCKVGPITAAASVTADDTNNIWVFFGSGRFLDTNDKTNADVQHFFGVKDCIVTGKCVDQTDEQNDLVNVSSAEVLVGGTLVTSIETATSFDSLIDLVKSKEGWFTTLPNAKNADGTFVTNKRERNLSAPTVLGGTVFFTTFVPTNDLCVAAGDGNLYALFYQTGSAYKQSVIGTEAAGTKVSRAIGLGQGLPSQMAVQIGAQGTGASGSGGGSGCAGRVTGFIQASTGVLGSVCGTPALSSWSRMVAWRDL